MIQRPWEFRVHDNAAARALEEHCKLPPILAQILSAKGLTDQEEIRTFLETKISDLMDPDLLPGCVDAAKLIFGAIKSQEEIYVYGDYDADGMTGTAILYSAINLLGGKVRYFIPNRLEEGYGLSEDSLDQIQARGAKWVISVDCGISHLAAAQHAKEIGLKMIITDHHTMADQLPEAEAIVHPGLPGCDPRVGDLCGAGVAFKVAWALGQIERMAADRIDPEDQVVDEKERKKVSPKLRDFLITAMGWAAIGTVADMVPLVGENRVLVKFGLLSLTKSPGVGLGELFKLAKIHQKPVLKADDIGFTIGPRLNAAGRLGQAQLGVELLTTNDRQRAATLAEYLTGLNQSRDKLDRRIYNDVVQKVKDEFEGEDPSQAVPSDAAIVMASYKWHVGVIGIAAGRISEKYNLPTILISLDETGNKPGTGSARSAKGVDLYESLAACQDQLISFGGHKAAAGLKIQPENIDLFRQAFCQQAEHAVKDKPEVLPVTIDVEAHLHQMTLETLSHIDKLAPFGQGNRRPVFCATGVQISNAKPMGSGDRHFSAMISQFETRMRAVAFGKGDWMEFLSDRQDPIDIAFRPVVNEFRGFKKVELHLVDWRPAVIAVGSAAN